MGVTENFIIKNSYRDSVFLMHTASEAEKIKGVEGVSLMMGTPANKEILKDSGFLTPEGNAASHNDLIIAVKADGPEPLEKAGTFINESFRSSEADIREKDGEYSPDNLEGALRVMPEANFALISVSGQYAGREARKALESGLNVMIFSDNVSIEAEVNLKKTASEKGLILMGPDCGTAIINGVPMGFANAIPRGDIGIAAASGSGLQEVTVNIARLGSGISQAFGTGGRDLRREVGGITMLSAIDYLASDQQTSVILVLSKPPDPDVAEAVLERAADAGKPAVICFLGRPAAQSKGSLFFSGTLEEAAAAAAGLSAGVKKAPPALPKEEFEVIKEKSRALLKKGGKHIRGFYAGGTLCDEALAVINLKGIRASAGSALNKSGHILTDFGADEFTLGKPHPMIDLTLRNSRMLREADNPETAVMLFDVVLGYGAHPDPAGGMKETLKRIKERKILLASVCGTENDPQRFSKQVRTLKEAGVFIFPTNAQAAGFAAEIIKKDI